MYVYNKIFSVFYTYKDTVNVCFTLVDQAHLAKERAKTDAEHYRAMKEAEANKVL